MRSSLAVAFLLCLFACQPDKQDDSKVHLITLDPGHFHAALVQKSMYSDVDSIVQVYSPEGSDLDLHLGRIDSYNNRSESPTHWIEEVYKGPDFLERMVSARNRKGNVVVLSGNNQKKTNYILRSIEADINVLADKPMAISSQDFKLLLRSFELARQKNLLLYDIMTERFEITTILQRELSQIPDIFGQLEKGSLSNPAITKESVHHFYKYVSGNVLTRPAWFMDVEQQGEGLVDVMTHLVDLVQWECFPEQVLDTTDVQIVSASRWTTAMTQDQFKNITKEERIPSYLEKDILRDTLQIFSNGEINYKLRGIHAKTSVIWRYQAPAGSGDTHYSIMRGTKANLIIRQGVDEGFKPTLYIESSTDQKIPTSLILDKFQGVKAKYPLLDLRQTENGWMVVVPDQYRDGHEAHFARVMENYLKYLKTSNMPVWEVPNMITKYYTTSQAAKIAKTK